MVELGFKPGALTQALLLRMERMDFTQQESPGSGSCSLHVPSNKQFTTCQSLPVNQFCWWGGSVPFLLPTSMGIYSLGLEKVKRRLRSTGLVLQLCSLRQTLLGPSLGAWQMDSSSLSKVLGDYTTSGGGRHLGLVDVRSVSVPCSLRPLKAPRSQSLSFPSLPHSLLSSGLLHPWGAGKPLHT